jgi:nitroimidazol reductase NimA-like FMN-containing flavoprotein (pyridoxamine 5'-phosphate oxidase superfamily)
MEYSYPVPSSTARKKVELLGSSVTGYGYAGTAMPARDVTGPAEWPRASLRKQWESVPPSMPFPPDHSTRQNLLTENREFDSSPWATYTYHMASDTPADLDALVANEMTSEEIDAALRDHGSGVLSLARDGESYAIPVSYGYDGERCYFVFVGYREPSRKAEFAATTERATLTVYEADGRDDWHSVVVRGPLTRLDDEDEWERARSAIDDNAWYPSLFRNADPRGRVDLWALDPEETTGYVGRS